MYSFRSSKGRFKFWRFSMTQLMVVRLGMNLLKMCLLILGFKGPGKVVHFIGLVSTALAMHCIIETYVALRLQLEHFQAEKKFICIKILVGIALLQPLLTNALETVGAFPDDVLYGYSSRKWSQRVLGTVSVIQMVVFSLLLSFAFSLKYTLRDQAADKSESDLDGSDAEHKLLLSPSSRMEVKMTTFQLTKIWDVIMCHTIDESFTGISLHVSDRLDMDRSVSLSSSMLDSFRSVQMTDRTV